MKISFIHLFFVHGNSLIAHDACSKSGYSCACGQELSTVLKLAKTIPVGKEKGVVVDCKIIP
jgi:hypothetical protein